MQLAIIDYPSLEIGLRWAADEAREVIQLNLLAHRLDRRARQGSTASRVHALKAATQSV
jgi:hypothetical protein